MKAPAVIASVTIACSLGFAAGQGRPAMPPQDMATPPIPPKDSMTRDGSGDRGGVAMQMGGADDCVVIGEPVYMFTRPWYDYSQIHRFPSCSGQSWGDVGIIARGQLSVDLNGDGTQDRVVAMHRGQDCLPFYTDRYNYYTYGVCRDPSGSSGPDVTSTLWLETLTWTGSSVAVVQQPLFWNQHGSLAELYFDNLTPEWRHSFYEHMFLDLRDLDGDGDLDLIVRLVGTRNNDTVLEQITEFVWFENSAATNTSGGADVNRDGIVDGKDLAYVLSAWTP